MQKYNKNVISYKRYYEIKKISVMQTNPLYWNLFDEWKVCLVFQYFT